MRGFKAAVVGVSVALMALAAPPPATAASLGVDITSNGPNGFAVTNPGFTIGWGFDVTTPVTVTALGVWDEGSNGLNEAHQVGLWTGNGTLLASTTVPSGLTADSSASSALGLGQWLFENIAALALAPGPYVMGSVSGNDDFRTIQGNIALNAAFDDFDSGKFAFGGGLQFPGLDEPSDLSLFGPNMLLQTPAPAAAPATLLLLGLGLMGMGARRVARQASR